MANDELKRALHSRETPHTDDWAEAAARVSERYGNAVDDFLGVLYQRKRTALGVLGSFLELAKVNHSYKTPNGTFRVWKLGQHRTLYGVDSIYPHRIAFLLPNGDVCRVNDGNEYVDVAYALANTVRSLVEEVEAVTAHKFVSDWAKRVSTAVNVGEVLVYEGEHRGEPVTAKFLVS